jgi:multiple sugar transport system permease protein
VAIHQAGEEELKSDEAAERGSDGGTSEERFSSPSSLRRPPYPVVAPSLPRERWGDIGKGLAFLSPWLIGFSVFTVTPIVLSFYFSLTEYSLLSPPMPIGLDNYRDLMRDRWFWNAMSVTAKYALMALPAGMCVSLGLAILLNQPIRGQSYYRTAIFLPTLVPVAASAMIWLWLFNTKLGLLNYVLDVLHLPPVPWLTNPSVALPAMAFMSLWSVGHTVVIYLAGLQDVPVELYEAAELDGATGWRRMWHVTLPMISPVIFFNLIIAIIGVFRVFEMPLIMTNGGPARATQFIAMYVYDMAFLYVRMGYASAMAWIQLIIVLILTGIAFWTSKRWVHYQGK